MTEKKTTFAEAKRIVRDLGFSLTKHDGEYRLAPLGGMNTAEDRAAYTDDLDDAIGTARAEAARMALVASANVGPALSDARIDALAASAQQGFANWSIMWDELRSMAAEIRRHRNGGTV